MAWLILIPCLAGSISLDRVSASEENDPDHWISGSDEWAQLEKGEVVLLDTRSEPESGGGAGTLHSATAAILIDSSPSEVWSVVDDGDRAAEFQDSLESSRVVERNPEYSLVEQTVKIGLRRVSYVVRQVPDPPTLIEFSRESGDLEQMSGFWRLLDVSKSGEKRTLLIYRLSLEPDFPLPGFLLRKSIAGNLPDTLRSVRSEVLRRAEDS